MPDEKQMTTVRVAFKKTGALQFISHLDLMRTMTRLLVRADVNIYYTEGFNPKPKLVFALPLSVGTESVCELLDFKIYGFHPDLAEMKKRIVAESVPGIEIGDVYIPRTKFKDIAFSEYEITLHASALTEADADKINSIMSSPVILTKRTKSGDVECDIREYIKSISAEWKNGDIVIDTVLSADPVKYLNPEYIVTAVKGIIGYEENIAPGCDYHEIMRREILNSDGKRFR